MQRSRRSGRFEINTYRAGPLIPRAFWPQWFPDLSYSCSVKRYSYSYPKAGQMAVSLLTRLIQWTERVSEGLIEYEYRGAEFEYEYEEIPEPAASASRLMGVFPPSPLATRFCYFPAPSPSSICLAVSSSPAPR